jgi:AraC family transcriptional activator of mtrCDE
VIARESTDPLSSLAPLLRVRPSMRSLCGLCSRWEDCDHEAGHGASVPFHIVTDGACAIEFERITALQAGDVAVLLRGRRHVARGAASQLICGRLHFEQARHNLVLSALPELIVVRTAETPDASRMRELIAAIKAELERARPGSAAIAEDLARALFVMVLRAHLEHERAGSGLLCLLGHRHAARAVGAMLEDPGKPWTLDELAARAHASRASLVRMFQKMAGVPPLEFLAHLRLNLAHRKLHATTQPLAEIAAEIGYQSESAFSRAFRRRFGMPPSVARMGPELTS